MTQWRHPTTIFPLKMFVSERRAAKLLEQVRWREGGSLHIKIYLQRQTHTVSPSVSATS